MVEVQFQLIAEIADIGTSALMFSLNIDLEFYFKVSSFFFFLIEIHPMQG